MERTLVILKPDSVERKLVGEIISRFEKKGFNIVEMRMMKITESLAEVHYSHVRSEPIYNEMIDFITSGPVIVMVMEGDRIIEAVRKMVGKTSSFESPPGTIRGDYGSHRYKNLIHASDSQENAEIEIQRFFNN